LFQSKYELSAIIVHLGSDKQGHFYSIAKHNGRWFKCNDEVVTEAKESDVLFRSAPKFVFYARTAYEAKTSESKIESNIATPRCESSIATGRKVGLVFGELGANAETELVKKFAKISIGNT
jgi:hypothetical protein